MPKFVKYFLLTAKNGNGNGWKINPDTADHNMKYFVNRPLVCTSREWIPTSVYETYDHPYLNTNNLYSVLQHQEPYRVGTITEISKEGDNYYAIAKILPKFENRIFPPFVSPAIFQLNPMEPENNISAWLPLHLAILDQQPAYGARVAILRGSCIGTPEACSIQLKTAKMITTLVCPLKKSHVLNKLHKLERNEMPYQTADEMRLKEMKTQIGMLKQKNASLDDSESVHLENAMKKITPEGHESGLGGSQFISRDGDIMGDANEDHRVSVNTALHQTGEHEHIFNKMDSPSDRLDYFLKKTGAIRSYSGDDNMNLDIYHPPTLAQRRVIKEHLESHNISPERVNIETNHKMKGVSEDTMKHRLGIYEGEFAKLAIYRTSPQDRRREKIQEFYRKTPNQKLPPEEYDIEKKYIDTGEPIRPPTPKREEFNKIISAKDKKVYTPEEAGFVRSQTPRKCATCEYFQYPNICNLPLTIPVDPELDCCNHWEPEKKSRGDIINEGTKTSKLFSMVKIAESVEKEPDEFFDFINASQKEHLQRPEGMKDIKALVTKPWNDLTPEEKKDVKDEMKQRYADVNGKVKMDKVIEWRKSINDDLYHHFLDPDNWWLPQSWELAQKKVEDYSDQEKNELIRTFCFRHGGVDVSHLLIGDGNGVFGNMEPNENHYKLVDYKKHLMRIAELESKIENMKDGLHPNAHKVHEELRKTTQNINNPLPSKMSMFMTPEGEFVGDDSIGGDHETMVRNHGPTVDINPKPGIIDHKDITNFMKKTGMIRVQSFPRRQKYNFHIASPISQQQLKSIRDVEKSDPNSEINGVIESESGEEHQSGFRGILDGLRAHRMVKTSKEELKYKLAMLKKANRVGNKLQKISISSVGPKWDPHEVRQKLKNLNLDVPQFNDAKKGYDKINSPSLHKNGFTYVPHLNRAFGAPEGKELHKIFGNGKDPLHAIAVTDEPGTELNEKHRQAYNELVKQGKRPTIGGYTETDGKKYTDIGVIEPMSDDKAREQLKKYNQRSSGRYDLDGKFTIFKG